MNQSTCKFLPYFPEANRNYTLSRDGGVMPIDIQPPHISSEESPKEILLSDFKSLVEMPIKGGWGYTLDDAVIIDKSDSVIPEMPFDGVGYEYVFVEKRIYEELIIFQPKNERYSGIKWNLLKQKVINRNDRQYDVLTFEVTAIPDKDWEELKTEWKGINRNNSPEFDIDVHMKKKDSLTIRYVTDYWFEITSFYGSNK